VPPGGVGMHPAAREVISIAASARRSEVGRQGIGVREAEASAAGADSEKSSLESLQCRCHAV